MTGDRAAQRAGARLPELAQGDLRVGRDREEQGDEGEQEQSSEQEQDLQPEARFHAPTNIMGTKRRRNWAEHERVW
jgi:hypothetical protein